MPFLRILENGEYRDDAGVAVVAVMLAPDDPAFRAEFSGYIRLRGRIKRLEIPTSRLTLRDGLRFAERRDQHQQAATRANEGRSVGYQLLYRLLLASAGVPNARLAHARRILVRGGAPIAEKAMQKAWQRLESVSHLWAVAVAWEREFGSIAGPDEYDFPNNLGIFLAQAEWVRERALNVLSDLKPSVASWVPPLDWRAPVWDKPFPLIRASAEILSWRDEIAAPRQRGRKRLIQK